MKILPQVIGAAAVVMFLLSYQQKTRSRIILFNVISRCLYILQYLFLGAFAGAVLDVLGAISAFAAGKKHTPFIRKHTKVIFVVINAVILLAGGAIAFINKSWLDVFSIVGVLLHTGAFWMNDEKKIRYVSLVGTPCWFVYNFMSRAYGSAVGDALTMCSIILAIIKFKKTDLAKRNEIAD